MKHRANIIITAEFEAGDEDPKTFITRHMDSLLPASFEFSVVNLSRVKRAVKVLGEFAPDHVLPFITDSTDRKEYVIDGQSYMVRMDSHRYHVFAKNRACVACGLEGTKFLLELPPDSPQPHFNLYGEEHGQLVLMTKDHIRSRAHGGEDRHENYQTMCATCNCLKGSSRLTIESVRELRRLYNEMRRGASKKQLANRIRKAKQSMLLPAERGERDAYSQKMRATHLVESKAAKPRLVAKTDLVLGDANGHISALSRHEAEWRHTMGNPILVVGEILAGTRLETTGEYRQRKVGIWHNHKNVYIYHGLLEYEDVWDAAYVESLPKSLSIPA